MAREGLGRRRPLLGKALGQGRKRTAGRHRGPQGTREHLCLDNLAQFPLMGEAPAKPGGQPCLLGVQPGETHWLNSGGSPPLHLTPFKEDVCSRVKGFESLSKSREGRWWSSEVSVAVGRRKEA